MYKLLIADDNNMHIQCVLDYVDWDKLGFSEIKTASNGEEAMNIFHTFEPDLVITDIVMPQLNGVELAKNIREQDSRVHIIFMSCYEEYNYAKNAIDNDISAYILKPIVPKELNEIVQKVISDIEEHQKAVSSEQTISNFLPLVRESLLYRLLYSEDFLPSEEMLTNARFSEVKQTMLIKYMFLGDSNNINSLYKVISSIGSQYDGFTADAVAELPGRLVLLLTTDSTDDEAFLNSSIKFCKEHMNTLRDRFELRAVAGFSNIYSSLNSAKQMLHQASSALENAYSLTDGEIYFFEDFEEIETERQDYRIHNLKEDLSSLLNKADTSAIDAFLDKYYPHTPHRNKNTVKALCFSTVTTLQLLLAERNMDMSELFEDSDIIWQKLNRFETIQDTYHWLKNILTATVEFVSSIENTNKNDIVYSIKDYIDKNFKDIQSLSQIASELYISSGYARNVFKKYTGQTIFDYLVDTRVREAKKLLRNPKYKIYEIRDLVGYTSKAHFIETFKRKTGMTPTEFRQSGE